MLYDDYEAYLVKYKAEYGESTLVLMQCGSFYELYDDGSKQTDLKQIGELLNIQVSRRNKSIIEVSRSNLEMAGFPSYTLNKFLNTLVANNFTCVIVSQTTPPPNPKREITDIVSPGTYIEEDCIIDTNYLMSIYVEEFCEYKTNKLCITAGASLVDLGTGKTYVFECASKSNDINYPLDELYRLIISYNPRELVINSRVKNKSSMLSYEQLVSYLDLDGKCVHNEFEKQDSNEVYKLSYQEELLKTVYPSSGLLSRIDFIGLDRMPCGLISFIKLLQFVNNHNETILKKIHVPQILEASNSLVLSYNSIKQLDIVPRNINSKKSKSSSLLDILNNCKTAVGRRYFRERLLCPSNDIIKLNNSYSNIKALIEKHKEIKLLEKIKNELSDIYDIERIFRKIDLGSVQPYEIGYIVMSLSKLQNILNILKEHEVDVLFDGCDKNCIPIYIETIETIIRDKLNVEELLKHNNDNLSPSIFNSGVNTTLDELFNEMNNTKGYVYDICDKLNTLTSQDSMFKVENNDREGYYLIITKKRYQDFFNQNSSKMISTNIGTVIKVNDLDTKSVSHTSTSCKVFHKSFKIISDKIELLSLKIKKISLDTYKNILSVISQTTSRYSCELTKCLAYLDFYWCCSSNAYYNKYSCPEINNEFENKSFMKVGELRHPIIEKLNTNIEYVSNSVVLGANDCDGILLYGLNSSGKSSLMKSIGLAIIMAQAGMYVACDKFEYYPYDYLFTRIFSNDDIFKGQSTFTKEMMELRGIIKRANSNSLVLGDELCSGTESISALSIVSAGVYTLSQRRSSFIFATHLHDLITIPIVKELDNVLTYHLSVEYDKGLQVLIYDRKLKPGNGSSLYGLEVCKSLDLEKDFLDIANTVRQGILNIEKKIISETSNNNKYNREVYKDKCGICNEKAVEIHHINEQKNADVDGYINGRFHKNDKFNLVCLCEKCHDNVHNGTLDIKGYIQRSDGVVLDYGIAEDKEHNEDVSYDDKSNNGIETKIRQLMNSHPNMKKKDIILTIKQQYNDMNITSYRIEKIMKALKNK
jgi:DNA mismatch repair protein MutS